MENPAHLTPKGPRAIARILVDSPLPQLDRLFDYRIPDELTDDVRQGVRVTVPLRTAGRVLQGYVVDTDIEPDEERVLADIETVVSAAPVMPPRLHRLARAVADRQAGSAIDVLRLVIPRRMVRAERTWLAAEPPEQWRPDASVHTAATDTLDVFSGLVEAIREGGRIALDAPPGIDGAQPRWTALLAAAAIETIAGGASAIIAVPNHRDLALLEAAVRDATPDAPLVRLDADQSNPARYANYLRTLDDAPCIVIGNRSAVYAPVARLGMLAVWDDGDPLFEEPLAPYAHARDAALVRQSLHGGALVLCGHTRSSDVQRLVRIGFVAETPPVRRQSPRVVLAAPQDAPRTGRIPSAAFRSAREALETGPVLVQVARPGYAPALVCAECRSPARCVCGGPLHAPARGATPVCRWCGRSAHAWQCSSCEATRVRLASSGSERTADELGRAFPGVRISVADGAHPVERIGSEPALVVATRGAEPVAEGGYRAVLLLDGDRMLQAPDLRIGEFCLRWWSNAAALAAPEAVVHLVGVTGPVARALATWTQSAYADRELGERAPLAMPPAVRVASIAGDEQDVTDALAQLVDGVPELGTDAVLGPVPAEEADGRRRVRALVRFEYARGASVAKALRAAVVSAAVTSRSRKPRGKGASPRQRSSPPTLSVRLDVADPDL